MRKSLRYATVLFFLSLFVMAVSMGTDVAFPLGIGGPLEDVVMWDAGEHVGGEGVGSTDGTAVTGAAPDARDEAAVVFFDSDTDNPTSRTEEAVASSSDDEEDGLANASEDDAEPVLASAKTSAETDEGAAEEEPESRPLIVTHTVQAGETLWDISRMYDIDVDTILAANETVDPNRLRIGETLTILTERGALHTVQSGESLWDISRLYGVTIDEIASRNGIADPSRLQVQTRLVIPGAQAQAAALRRDAVVSSDGRLIRNFEWPLRARISSPYGMRWGRMHHGLDIAVPVGTPVRAAAGGVVTFSGVQGGYGNIVIIDHGNGVETRYAHLSRMVVSRGQRVARGELIAYSGNTGNSTGPHLHFEIRQRGQSVNPQQYLK